MIITTNIPCGNGRVHWIDRDTVEIELIAYSKGARYTTFQISGVTADGDRIITLRPDSLQGGDFSKFHTPVWWRILPDGDWVALPADRVRIEPDGIQLRLPLREGMDIQVSSEPPRPYAETVLELQALARKHRDDAELHWIGYSFECRPIPVLRITSDVRTHGEPGAEKRPVILCMAGEHATESAGEEITRGMMAAALEDSEEGQLLRDTYVMDFLLTPNPDGNYHSWHQYNKKDWLQHNYAEVVDRSWHHEFGPYFAGTLEDPSPETIAVADWVSQTSPVFHHNAHSWQGHHGNPGAFRTDPQNLKSPLKEMIEQMDRLALETARGMGIEFEIYPTGNLCAGHIVDYFVHEQKCPAYSIEGHMKLGRARLQELGGQIFKAWLGPQGVLAPMSLGVY